jgi:RHS repeat-associated protein
MRVQLSCARTECICSRCGLAMDPTNKVSLSLTPTFAARTTTRKTMIGYRQLIVGCLMALAVLTSAWAQDGGVNFQEEYSRLTKSDQSVTKYDTGLFGESVNLYTGATEFTATDVSLPGNGTLPVAFGRKRTVENHGGAGDAGSPYALGDWDIEAPFLSGVYLNGGGWTVSTPQPLNRCSSPTNTNDVQPPPVSLRNFWRIILAKDYWQGTSMYVPGQGSQELLMFTDPSIAHPSGAKWVTKSNWFLSCALIDSTQGEGFVARSPDGLIYHFDTMIRGTWYPSIVWARGDGSADRIPREQVRIYASSVEDRHGNFVHYNFTGNKLTSITANDGRQITITYDAVSGKVASVFDGTRTWQYGYAPANDAHGVLTRVTLPDSSQWQIDFSNISWGLVAYDNTTEPPNPMPNQRWKYVHDRTLSCSFMRVLDDIHNRHVVSLVHPSGARGDFTFLVKRHGRAAVTPDCEAAVEGDADTEYNQAPPRSDVHSLVAKTISGPGLPAAGYQWLYNYTLPIGSYSTDPACQVNPPPQPPDRCAMTKKVDVTAPDGTKTIYTYGIKFEDTESQLLATETRDAGNALLRSETSTFVANAAPWLQPFPDKMGQSTQPRTDTFLAEHLRPQIEHAIAQYGAKDSSTFTSHINSFDGFAHPTSVSKFSSLPGAVVKTELMAYQDNLPRWVIGLPTTVTDQASNVVISQTDYDPTYLLPSQTRSFGRMLKQFQYQTGGLAWKITDANAHTITVTDFYRGVPRRIDFPTGTFSSAVVNNLGGLDAVADELANVTHLYYDVAGRLNRIAYPTGDPTVWNDTTLGFTQSSVCHFGTGSGCVGGLSPGHWLQTVTTGSGTKTTYFDALWRPVATVGLDSNNSAGTLRYSTHGYDFSSRETFTGYPVTALTTIAANTTGTHNQFDGLGRPTTSTQDSELGPLTTTTNYLADFQKQVIDPIGHGTTTSYQAFDQPSEDAPLQIVAPETLTVNIVRDIYGKPRSLRRSGTNRSDGSLQTVDYTRSFVYDANELLCKTIDPEIGATIQDYDPAGNLSWSASGVAAPSTTSCDRTSVPTNKKATRGYDFLNRLTSVSYGDGSPAITRTYYADGQLQSLTAGTSTWLYDYNHRRLPTTENAIIDSSSYTLINDYNANGHLKSVTYPDYVQVDYAPNALGEPTQASPYASAVTTYPNGAIKSFTYANGIVHTLTQNTRGLPQESKDVGVLDDVYTYDANANVHSINDQFQGLTSRSMAYDNLDRLTATSAPGIWGTASYVYDAVDNLRSSVVGIRNCIHNYNAANNQLTGLSGSCATSYLYDAGGNLSQRGDQHFVFDIANRLASTNGAQSSNNESYSYDGNGRRTVVMRNDGTHRHMLYSQSGQLRYEYDSRNAGTTDYIYLGRSLIAREGTATVIPPGSAPVLTAPASNTTGSYTVSWSTPAGATSYSLQRNLNSTGWIDVYSGSATSFNEVGRLTGSYQYQVKACAGAGVCSAYSNIVTVNENNIAPPVPTLTVPATSSNGTYTVSWTTPPNTFAYVLEEQVGAGPWSPLKATEGNPPPTFKDIIGRPDGTYHYRVSACNVICGVPSNIGTVVVHIVIVPGAPVLTVSTAISTTGDFSLSWTTPANTTSFVLYESRDNVTFITVASQASAGYSISGYANGTYYYKVVACNGPCGAFSNTVTVQVNRPIVPLPPVSISVAAGGTAGSFTVSWVPSPTGPTATRFRLEQSFNSGAWTSQQNTAALSYPANNQPSGTYEFRVKACNGPTDATNCSTTTGPASIVVLGLPGTSTITITPSPISTDGNYTVSWTTVVPAATEYWLFEKVDSQGNFTQVYTGPLLSYTPPTKPNGTYTYYVRAKNSSGGGLNSANVSVMVQIPGAPPIPTGLSGPTGVVQVPGNTFLITWNTVSGATYLLQERTSCNLTVTVTDMGTETQFEKQWIGCLTPTGSRTDTFAVKACYTPANCSPWSNPITIQLFQTDSGGGNRPAAATTSTLPTYLHTDALGSPIAETNSAAAVVKRNRYEPYGAPTDNIYTDGPGYTGHVTDAATQLTYMQQRYYDPIAARFLSLDPVAASPVSFNRYWYADNNPYSNVDPDGRWAAAVGAGLLVCARIAPCRNLVVTAAAAAIVTVAKLARDLSAPSVNVLPLTTMNNEGAEEDSPPPAATPNEGEGEGAAEATPNVVVGINVGSSPAEAREALEKAGHPGESITNESGTETGTKHSVPPKMEVRVMDGGPDHGPRVVTAREGNPKQLVRASDGKNFPNGTTVKEQRLGSHILFEKDK